MKTSSEIQTIDQSSVVPMETSVMQILQSALERGTDADSLGKLLDMQERILNRQAEQAYTVAMVELQSNVPKIVKNKTNDQTRSKYANMDAVLAAITPVYTSKGFSLSFGTTDSPHPGHVRVTCDVMHSAGHSKPYMVDVPLDMEGIKGNKNKTEVHGTGSAISYGRRYLTLLIFNLNTGDDDDGNGAGSGYVTQEQKEEIERTAKEVNANIQGLLNFCKAESFETILACDHKKVMMMLESKRQKK